jgi:hypothetical protein
MTTKEGNAMNDEELRNGLKDLKYFSELTQREEYFSGAFDPNLLDALTAFIKSRDQQIALAAHEQGRKVGQYQAADKLYGDVTQIYMFGGNESAAKAKSIAGWSANGLLKDCEAFMNDNNDAYQSHLATLKEQQNKTNGDLVGGVK